MFAKQLQRAYFRYRRYVPSRILYHPDYFRVARQLGESAQEQSRLADLLLRERLADAVTHVPYYRERVRIDPQAIRQASSGAEVIREFPYLERQTFMDAPERFLSDRYRWRPLHRATSAGSTGEGIVVWRTKRLIDIEMAFFASAWSVYGFRFERSRTLRLSLIHI